MCWEGISQSTIRETILGEEVNAFPSTSTTEKPKLLNFSFKISIYISLRLFRGKGGLFDEWEIRRNLLMEMAKGAVEKWEWVATTSLNVSDYNKGKKWQSAGEIP